MAGTWLSVVEGFGGKRIKDGKLSFAPQIPERWSNYSFKILYKGSVIVVIVDHEKTKIFNHSDQDIKILLYNQPYKLNKNSTLEVETMNHKVKK
jgi:maltose phosphorylase